MCSIIWTSWSSSPPFLRREWSRFSAGSSPRRTLPLLARLRSGLTDFVGQELLDLSTVPVWSDERPRAPPRGAARFYGGLGRFLDRDARGLARVSPSPDTPVVSMQRGGGSKDTWVLSRTGGHLTHAPPPGLASRSESRRRHRPAQPRGRPSLLAGPLRRTLRAPGPRPALHPGPAHRRVRLRHVRLGIPDELYECLESPHSRLAEDDPQGHLDQGQIWSRRSSP